MIRTEIWCPLLHAINERINQAAKYTLYLQKKLYYMTSYCLIKSSEIDRVFSAVDMRAAKPAWTTLCLHALQLLGLPFLISSLNSIATEV